MNETRTQSCNRFSVYLADEQSGNLVKKKTVGQAYLPSGHATYHLHLYSFMNEYFYIIPSREDKNKVLLMTRELSKSTSKRYFWHPVGGGDILETSGVMKLRFDLFAPPLFMNLSPEKQDRSVNKSVDNFLTKESI